jgi:hypothetical protein
LIPGESLTFQPRQYVSEIVSSRIVSASDD